MSSHSRARGGISPGTEGQLAMVTTNAFPVTTLPTSLFHHYDAFDKPYNRARSLEIIERLQLQNPSVFNPRAAYDGQKNMFRSKALDMPAGSLRFTVYMGGNPEDSNPSKKGIDVHLSRVAVINPSSLLPVLRGQQPHSSESLTAITLLNVLVRMQPIMTYPSKGRAFFTKEMRDLDIGMGLELWRGFFQSVRPTMDRLIVNVDIATAVMYQGGPLLSLVKAFLRIQNLRELRPNLVDLPQQRKLQSFLKNLLVRSTVPKPTPGKRQKVRPIRSLVMTGADKYRFEKETPNEYPEELTISEYFLKYHRYTVQLGEALCVGFGRDIVYPLEVLEVVEGQIYKKNLPPSLASRALKFATQKPHERLKTIEKGSKVFAYADSDYLRHSGVQIDPRALQVPARILPPPTIQYGGPHGHTKPMNGAWNLVGKRLFRPAEVPAWAVICFDLHVDFRAATKFVMNQVAVCEELGMRFAKTKPPIIAGKAQANAEDFHTQLDNAAIAAREAFEAETNAEFPRFILVILPDSAADIRRAVKNWGDCVRGCPTQCMKGGRLVRANNQYHNNLALKINAKLSGINSVPSSDVEAMRWMAHLPTMIVGADVSHPSPGSDSPSVTGLVSSVDEQASRYVASTSIQTSRMEIIEDLESMMKNAVMKFNDYQKAMFDRDIYPYRVIFYRDGVSEGQFEEVAQKEVATVKKILAQLPRARNPAPCKLTFIIVSKKHHIRFFPRQGEGDSSGNCRAGLVIDQGIVNPVAFDFYLQSHSGILGTSRSSHYSVIEDENELGADPLQAISYTLCHVYARATRSVSIPAPVYYADLVCSRGSFHSTLLQEGSDVSSMVPGQEPSLELHRQKFRAVAENIAKTMYFV